VGNGKHKKKDVRRHRRQKGDTRGDVKRCILQKPEKEVQETYGRRHCWGVQLETHSWKGTVHAGGGLRDCRSSERLQRRDSPEVL